MNSVELRGSASRSRREEGAEPTRADVLELERLCDDSSLASAYARISGFSEPEQWSDPQAIAVAARLFTHVGAPKRAFRLALRAWRLDRGCAEAGYWVGSGLFDRVGALPVWDWLERMPRTDGPPRALASLAWLRSSVLSALRDFAAAENWLERGHALAPDYAYGRVMRISWLVQQDRHEEALDMARDVVACYPTSRSAILSFAELLELSGAFEEALDVLRAHAPKAQGGSLFVAAAGLECELSLWSDVLVSVQAAEKLWPLAEERERKQLAALRCEAAYHLGDDAQASAHAKLVGSHFHGRMAERLERGERGAYRVLGVGFVRQHHLTCAPATLSTLSRYWGKPVDHLELAERICYNGTRSHAGREWAEQGGWLAREFAVTWEIARALIDRGVPFTVDTVEAISAHAQAVIGYDERLATLLIRDPYFPKKVEAIADEFVETYRAHGPRGFAMVPKARADLLAGVTFPDAELYDLADRLEAALDRHDRVAARALSDELQARGPEHHLSLLAQRALAAYDANPFELQRIAEQALERYPREPTWRMTLLDVLERTASAPHIEQRLAEICQERDVHPVFRERLAERLLGDARRTEEAARILRRVQRQLPGRAETVGLLGRCAWQTCDFDRALWLYRIAACLEPTLEAWARAYFEAASALRRGDEAIELLAQRAERYRRRAAGPSITLFRALDYVDRTREAFDSLEHALRARPDDGALRLFASEAFARYGNEQEAKGHLDRARDCSARSAWLRASAVVAASAADHEGAIAAWRAVVESEPLAADAHEALATRLAIARGSTAAREHVAAASARFPENADLLELHVRWLSDQDPETREAALRRLLELEPRHPWARRELVLVLGKQQRIEAAKAECAIALQVTLHDPSGPLVRARLCELEGDLAGARSAYHEALVLAADAVPAISSLVESAADSAETREALEFVERRIAESSVTGDGVFAWFRAARRHLQKSELETRLLALRERRADLWAVGSCLVDHYCDTGQLQLALGAAEQATARFPLLAGVWLDLAQVQRLLARPEDEVAACERAVAVSPGFVRGVLALADAWKHQARPENSLHVLERGLRHQPSNPALCVARADVQWNLGQREAALVSLRAATEADPTDGEAWQRLLSWAAGSDVDVVALVREVAVKRPWDQNAWLRLAELESDRDLNAALTAVQRALELDPHWLEAHDLQAVTYARMGRRQRALSACKAAVFQRRQPLVLRGRAAWVHASFGDKKKALKRMRSLVSERPDYFWGLQQIADWAEELGEKAIALQAAEAMVRLEPNAAMVHGYLGQALMDAGRKQEARSSFRRALELKPDYMFAADRYLRLLLEASQFVRARRALERFARYAPGPLAHRLELMLALAQQDRHGAEQAFESLLRHADTPNDLILIGTRELAEQHYHSAQRILFEALEQPLHRPVIAAAWAEVRLLRGKFPSLRIVRRLRRADPRAAVALLDAAFHHAGTVRRMTPVLGLTLFNWRLARASDELWAAMGYALVNCGWRVAAAFWLHGYERRKVSAWALLNLAIVLRDWGFVGRAQRVSQHALAAPPDHTRGAHLTFLAFDAAVKGRSEDSAEWLSDVGQNHSSVFFQRLHELVSAMLELERAPDDERRAAAAYARACLAPLYPAPVLRFYNPETIQWRRAARRIGRSAKNVSDLMKGHATEMWAVAGTTLIVVTIVTGNGEALLGLLFWLVFWYIFGLLKR